MKQLMILVACWCFSAAGYTQDRSVSGDWESKFAGNVTLIFHFSVGPDGKPGGNLDIPEQGAQKLPFTVATLTKDSLRIELEMPKASYAGKFVNDSTVNGSWMQGAARIPLSFKKGSSAVALRRPQTPLPPFNYNSEEVEYNNQDQSVHFGATFTYPRNQPVIATVILLNGSGLQDRDATVFNHKPFAVIADHLTRNGYAVLRIDDRGIGKTKGKLDSVTSADFLKDAEAAMAYVRTRKESSGRKLGFIGHSEGGLIAVMAAAAHPEAVDFVVTLAGPAEKGAKLLADQNEAIAIRQGISADAAAAYRDLFYGAAAAAASETGSDAVYRKAWGSYLDWKKKQQPEVLAKMGIFVGMPGVFNDTLAKQWLQSVLPAFASSWIRYFLTSDGAAYVAQLKCKLLALNGSEDIQVIARTNLAAVRDAISRSKITVSEVKELPGLNHLFQHCKACTVQEYGTLEETFAPEVLELMTGWLNQHVK